MTARVYSPITQCEGKQRYSTKTDAKRAVKKIEQHHGQRLMVYRCPHCGWFHTGHRPAKGYNWQ